jgi:hypothetical protein
MARKVPVPEIPPVPSRWSGHAAAESRLPSGRPAPSKRSQRSELPDLMEAFWGDGASAGEVPETGRPPSRHRSAGQSALG